MLTFATPSSTAADLLLGARYGYFQRNGRVLSGYRLPALEVGDITFTDATLPPPWFTAAVINEVVRAVMVPGSDYYQFRVNTPAGVLSLDPGEWLYHDQQTGAFLADSHTETAHPLLLRQATRTAVARWSITKRHPQALVVPCLHGLAHHHGRLVSVYRHSGFVFEGSSGLPPDWVLDAIFRDRVILYGPATIPAIITTRVDTPDGPVLLLSGDYLLRDTDGTLRVLNGRATTHAVDENGHLWFPKATPRAWDGERLALIP